MDYMEIPGAPGYFAGSNGEIYSDWRNKGRSYQWFHILKKNIQSSGKYYYVSVKRNNKRTTHRVHRLICIAFHGVPPTDKHTASHLDGNWRNNIPSNLKWELISENHQRKKEHATDDIGYKNSRVKINKEQLHEIRNLLAKGLKHQEIADMFNVNRVFITKINTGDRYKNQ